MTHPVRTRFAPSPTGALHIGGVRTALFSWLYARHHGGQYVLRIEDTDRERSTEESARAILEAFEWLGLDADEGPYFQSRRLDRYREVAEDMIGRGLAYRCYCTQEELADMRAAQSARGEKPRYDGRCRERTEPRPDVAPVVRFRQPREGVVAVDDLIHGRTVFENDELDDLVILRSDATPTYHFGVVVDDTDMRISHVIRGDDHLNNTPRHINLFLALGLEPPRYAHIPMIAGPDGAKLSKRHGAVSVLEYRELGYLPEAMLNYLVRLGWAHGDQELFSREEMIRLFDLSGVQRSAARFDPEKLNWLNQQYIKQADVARLAEELAAQLETLGVKTAAKAAADGIEAGTDDIEAGVKAGVEAGGTAAALEPIAEAFRERAETLREMAEKARVYVEDAFDYDAKAAKKHLQPAAAPLLRQVAERLVALDAWSEDALHAAVEAVAREAEVGLGKVAQPLRVAVTGGTASPGIGVTLAILGREKTLARIDRALRHIADNGAG